MSQSRGRSLAGVLLIGVLAIASNACAAHADRQQPNIIYLMLDDAGYGDNDEFELQADAILDFSENNPFGMP